MTIDIDLGVAVTNPSGLPSMTWATGVPNEAGNRWTGRTLGNVGSLIGTWQPEKGSQGLFGNFPTVAAASGHKVAHMDGQGQMLNDTAFGAQGSIGGVFRLDPAADLSGGMGLLRFTNSSGVDVGGFYVFTDGSLRIVRPNGTHFNTGVVIARGAWFTVGLAIDASTGGRAMVNGQSFTIPDGTGQAQIGKIGLGIYAGNANLVGDVAEVVTWTQRITANSLELFDTAMKNHYLFL